MFIEIVFTHSGRIYPVILPLVSYRKKLPPQQSKFIIFYYILNNYSFYSTGTVITILLTSDFCNMFYSKIGIIFSYFMGVGDRQDMSEKFLILSQLSNIHINFFFYLEQMVGELKNLLLL